MQTKHCSECMSELPLDALHFDRDNNTADGFRSECKVCRSEIRHQERQRKVDERLLKLDGNLVRMLTGALDANYTKLPHIAELWEAGIGIFGGPRGFMEHMLGTYLSSKPGSKERVKILEMMLRLGTKVTESGATKVPTELLSDEDLMREREELVKRLVVLAPPTEGEAHVA